MKFEIWYLNSKFWNMTFEIWNMPLWNPKSEIEKIGNMKSEIWNMTYEIWHMEPDIWNLKFGSWNSESESWNLKSGIWLIWQRLRICGKQTDQLTNCGSVGFDILFFQALSKPTEPHFVNRSVCCPPAFQAPPKPVEPHFVNRSVCFPLFPKRCQNPSSYILLIHRFCLPTFDNNVSLGRFGDKYKYLGISLV